VIEIFISIKEFLLFKLLTNFLQKMTTKKGFTLIELLVVVAIIGILASVVLASLGSARDKAKAASVKSALNSGRSAMEISFIDTGYYNTDGLTGTTCNTAIDTFDAAAEAQAGTGAAVCLSVSGGGSYSFSSSLPGGSGSGAFFCVDSSGFAGEQAATATDGTNC
jgi:prepilin-type N-terminal cleavage/methylation domain-containing protein